MYQCIIFDVDGTLVNTEKAIILSLQKIIREEIGKDIHEEDLDFVLGIPGADALKQLGVDDVVGANRRWCVYMDEFLEHITEYDGVSNVLKFLKDTEIITGVVTSRTKDEINRDDILLSMIAYLPHVVCADDTKRHKPEPEPMLKFIEMTNIDPSKTLYIGDSIYDYQCAKSAGVDFALALWGAKESDPIDAKYKFKDPSEILEILNI